MSRKQHVVERYGWEDSDKARAHDYIGPLVIRELRRRNAKRVLDLGCGNGALSHALSAEGFDVVGCDADEDGIEIARRGRGSFKVVSVYDDPEMLGEKNFDAVVSAEVIEHLFLPRYLPEFSRAVLREGGYLIVTTPYHGYIKNLALSVLNKWDKHLDPLWDGGHIKCWSKKTLTQLLYECGFVVEGFHGLGRFPYVWKSMAMVARKRG